MAPPALARSTSARLGRSTAPARCAGAKQRKDRYPHDPARHPPRRLPSRTRRRRDRARRGGGDRAATGESRHRGPRHRRRRPGRHPLVDAAAPLHDGDRLDIVTLKGDDPDAVDIQRHTASHVMAQADRPALPGHQVRHRPDHRERLLLRPRSCPSRSPTPTWRASRRRWRKIVSQNLPVERYELPVDEALAVFGAGEPGTGASGLPLGLDQPFKVELIEDLVTAAEATGDEVPTISVYRQGDFVDLCRGPHLPSTNKLGSGTFKLTSLAGAYWRGDEKNPMLTRVYGTAFPSKEELAAYLEALELARQRDHRRIGRDLDLFSFHEEGPGFPFFHPKGMRLWNAMIDYWRAEHVARRLRGDQHAGDPAPRALGAQRPLGQLQGEHVLHRDRRAAVRGEAHELPRRPAHLQEPPALLPRPAAAHGRARPCAPPRDERRAARPLPRALLHPGRRAHLLHPRAARGRGPRRASASCSTSTPPSASATSRSS